MDAIEIAEGDGGAACIGRHVLPTGENPHQRRGDAGTQVSPSITTSSFTINRVPKVTLFRGGFKSAISGIAPALCPTFTGARNSATAAADFAQARIRRRGVKPAANLPRAIRLPRRGRRGRLVCKLVSAYIWM
jgi:hypothetical protein